MKSKTALMKTRADKRTFVPGMLHNVSIAHLRLGCDWNVLGLLNIVVFIVNTPPF